MRSADQQLVNFLLRDSDGKPQGNFSSLEQMPDGRWSFIVGRRDTGEFYRHTVETVFLNEKQMQAISEKSAARENSEPEAIGFYRLCGHSASLGEIGNRARCTECQTRVDAEFKLFWDEIAFRDGILDIEEIKGNLVDYRNLIDNAKAVYIHVTGGNIGKLNTDASAVHRGSRPAGAKAYRLGS